MKGDLDQRNRKQVESTEDFKLRIAAIIGDKTEYNAGARQPHPMLVRKKRATYRKAKRAKTHKR